MGELEIPCLCQGCPSVNTWFPVATTATQDSPFSIFPLVLPSSGADRTPSFFSIPPSSFAFSLFLLDESLGRKEGSSSSLYDPSLGERKSVGARPFRSLNDSTCRERPSEADRLKEKRASQGTGKKGLSCAREAGCSKKPGRARFWKEKPCNSSYLGGK